MAWLRLFLRWAVHDLRLLWADVKGAFFYDETAWVVLAEDRSDINVKPWHVFGGGIAFGMDYESGTFVGNRRGAAEFASWRNSADIKATDPHGDAYYYIGTLADLN